MSSDDPRRTAPIAPEVEDVSDAPARFWLDYRGYRFELRDAPLVIGRSAGCQIVLDDAMVSRRHAVVRLTDGRVIAEDLGSVNGVFVNGDRIRGAQEVRVGDKVVIGKEELVLKMAFRTPETSPPRLSAETLSGVDASKMFTTLDGDREEGTHQGDSLELLGGVAEKVLALGRGEEAEKLLGNVLGNVLVAARARGQIDAGLAERAVRYAVRLAAATSRGRWIDYAIALYRVQRRPLPAAIVDELFTIMRSVKDVSVSDLRSYVSELRAIQAQLGPADRFLVQRLEGLERLASLR